ncbi:MerR family transcriptional regulator [Thioclava sp. 'Guangxiensis']|uniref:MerR family transcriptional regulator n=1 Tax=Thioclava sp. 'Guangxiensis' TaxID=3149044 RepID=UPI003878125A
MAKSADAFRTISETSEIVGVPSHVLRFWEGKFPQIKPTKRAGNRRYYRPDDIALLCGIRQLLHEDGLTIRGAQKVLKEQGIRHVSDLGRERLEAAEPLMEPSENLLAEREAKEADAVSDSMPVLSADDEAPQTAPVEDDAPHQPHSFLPEFDPLPGEEVMDSVPEDTAEAAPGMHDAASPSDLPPSFDDVWAQTPLFDDEPEEEEDFSPLIEDETDAPETEAAAGDDAARGAETPPVDAPVDAPVPQAEAVMPPAPRPSPEQSAAALAEISAPQASAEEPDHLPPTRISVVVARISTIRPEQMTRTEQVALRRAADKLHALRRELSREIRP